MASRQLALIRGGNRLLGFEVDDSSKPGFQYHNLWRRPAGRAKNGYGTSRECSETALREYGFSDHLIEAFLKIFRMVT